MGPCFKALVLYQNFTYSVNMQNKCFYLYKMFFVLPSVMKWGKKKKKKHTQNSWQILNMYSRYSLFSPIQHIQNFVWYMYNKQGILSMAINCLNISHLYAICLHSINHIYECMIYLHTHWYMVKKES